MRVSSSRRAILLKRQIGMPCSPVRRRGSFTDGAPGGAREIPGGGSVDLTAATNMLNCRKSSNCTAAQMNANSRERPWGINNPRWRLYAYGPIEQLAPLLRPAPVTSPSGLRDDAREQDGDPGSDAADEESGHGIVRVHAETFAAGGSTRVIEAELTRACRGEAAGACLAGHPCEIVAGIAAVNSLTLDLVPSKIAKRTF